MYVCVSVCNVGDDCCFGGEREEYNSGVMMMMISID